VRPEILEPTASPVTAAHADPTDQLDQTATLAKRDHPEKKDKSCPVTLELQDRQASPARAATADPEDHPDPPERTAKPAPPANLEPPATAVHPANLALPVPTETPATRDRRDRATTAHQLVSHQDIKIVTSPLLVLLFFTTASHVSNSHF
jgi:hypothetical protein